MKKARFIYLLLAASLFAFFAAAAGPLGLSDGGHPQIPLPGIHL